MVEINGYMQRGVLQALNPLSNIVTFIAIVPGAYAGEGKMWLKKTLIHFTRTVENQSLAADISLVVVERRSRTSLPGGHVVIESYHMAEAEQ